MKMSVKSRIPHGKSTKSSGLPVASKLPHHKSRLKPSTASKIKSLGVSSPPTFNLPLEPEENGNNVAFICSPNPSVNNNNSHLHRPGEDSLPLHENYLEGRVNFDEHCEVLSVSSAGLSPIKLLETDDSNSLVCSEDLDNSSFTSFIDNHSLHLDTDNYQSQLLVDNHAPDLIAFRRFQEILSPKSESGRTSPCTPKEQTPTRGRLPLPSSAALKPSGRFLKKGKSFPKNKAAQTGSKARSEALLVAKEDLKSAKTRGVVQQDRVLLPSEKLSPAHAMDYVRTLTGASEASPNALATRRRSRGYGESSAMQRYNGKADISEKTFRKVSVPSRTSGSSKGSGKWSNDIDSAMNIPRRNSRQLSEDELKSSNETLSTRVERRKQYQSSVKTDTANVDVRAVIGSVNKKKAGAKSPRIARPVVRPPRVRNRLLNSQESLSPDEKVVEDDLPEKTITSTNENSESSDKPQKVCENADTSDTEEMPEPRVNLSRRSSVPAQSEIRLNSGRSRPRRRASEHFNKRLLSGTSDESGYSTNTASSSYTDGNLPDRAAGDSVKHDIARMQERLKQNERYKGILENPEIVTFGHWRVKQEGNYAPEEMYGVTERRRIRSSSGSVSPVRKVSSPGKESLPATPNSQIREKEQDKESQLSEVEENNVFVNDNTKAKHNDRSKHVNFEEDGLNLSAMEDLPSLNSTALMGDYSIQSTFSSPEKPHVHSDQNAPHRDKTILTPSQHRAVNKLLEGGLNGMMDQDHLANLESTETAQAELLASPLRTRAASEDIQKMESRAASRGDLEAKLDEMQEEYKIVRSALEQLYKVLESEETHKKKQETEIANLTRKNDELHEQNDNLNKLLEIQQSVQQSQKREQLRMRVNPPCSSISSNHVSTQTHQDSTKPTWYKTELSTVGSKLESAVTQLQQMLDLKDEFSQNINDAEQKLKVLMSVVNDS